MTDLRVKLHFFTTNNPDHYWGATGRELPPRHYDKGVFLPLQESLSDIPELVCRDFTEVEELKFKHNNISARTMSLFSKDLKIAPIKRNLYFFIGDTPFIEKVKILKKAYIRKDAPRDDSLVQVNSAKIILRDAVVYILPLNQYEDLMAPLVLKKDLIFVVGNTSFLSRFDNKISKNSDKESIRELFYRDPKVYDIFSFSNQWLEKKSEVYFINIQDLENSANLLNELKNLIDLHIENLGKEMFKVMSLSADFSGSIDDNTLSEFVKEIRNHLK